MRWSGSCFERPNYMITVFNNELCCNSFGRSGPALDDTNREAYDALQNPFLLSLYANIVTPEDMPLAESGEVTAFLVVEDFWKRRVRGVSDGQRAVGLSELSQEPKRKSAVILSDKTLAAELVLIADTDDPQVISGVEMLLREGVIREQGADAVAWIHEWFKDTGAG